MKNNQLYVTMTPILLYYTNLFYVQSLYSSFIHYLKCRLQFQIEISLNFQYNNGCMKNWLVDAGYTTLGTTSPHRTTPYSIYWQHFSPVPCSREEYSLLLQETFYILLEQSNTTLEPTDLFKSSQFVPISLDFVVESRIM